MLNTDDGVSGIGLFPWIPRIQALIEPREIWLSHLSEMGDVCNIRTLLIRKVPRKSDVFFQSMDRRVKIS